MGRRWSLRTRFVAAAALCLLPLIGVALFVINSTLQHSRDQLLDTEFAVSDVVSQSLINVITDNEMVLVSLALDNRVRGMSATESQDALSEIRAARPSLNGLFLLDPNKNVVTVAGGIDPSAIIAQLQPVIDKAISTGEPAVSNRITITESNLEVVAVVAPVLPNPAASTEGKPVGAIGSFLSIDRLKSTFRPAAGFAAGETTITIVADGQVIADSATDTDRGAFLSNDLANGLAQSALNGKRVRMVYTDSKGDQRVAVAAPLGLTGVNWGVIVSSPSPLTYGPNRDLIDRGLIALGLAVLLTLVLAVIFGELTARPLRQLTEQAAAVRQGDASQGLVPVGRGEVAALSDAFRYMADELTTQVRDKEGAREEVALQAERLRELLRRTVRLQEDERRRIASDIHDAVSPLITGALYQTRAIRIASEQTNGDSGQDHSSEEMLSSVAELLERAMAELHDVVFALRPPDLDDLGVVAAIERYVNQVSRVGLPSRLEVTGEPRRLSPEARLGVYRIVQEALHNAQRHAHADEALVRLEWLEDRMRLTVRDNGSGFDTEQAYQPTSLGLLSMRERAAAIGGIMEIATRPGAGTAIILERTYSEDLVPEDVPDPAIDALSGSDSLLESNALESNGKEPEALESGSLHEVHSA